jgi:hypothetical protein
LTGIFIRDKLGIEKFTTIIELLRDTRRTSMLYQAHFSFEQGKNSKRHGSIIALMEAQDIDTAMTGFRSLLEKSRKSKHIPVEATRIYLDLVLQVKKIPEKGCIAHVLSRPGGLETAVSSSLPGVGRDYGEAFSMASDQKSGEDIEMEPFLVFD